MAKKADEITLSGLAEQYNKRYGEGTFVDGSAVVRDCPRLPFGIFPLDYSLGGGIPFNRSTSLWGPPESGKSTTASYLLYSAAHFCYECFRPEILCSCKTPTKKKPVLIDTEHKFDRSWADHIGICDVDYYYIQPDNGEQAVNIAETVMTAKDCGLVIIDSLAAIEPSSELEAAAEAAGYPAQPRLVSKMFRKVTQRLISEKKKNHPIAAIFLNQVRVQMGTSKFQSSEGQPGGAAAKFGYSLAVRIGARWLDQTEKDAYFNKETGQAYIHKCSSAVTKKQILTLNKSSEYSFVSEPGFQYPIGTMINEVNTIIKYARQHGVVQDNKGYVLGKKTYKTLKELGEALMENPKLKAATGLAVIKKAKLDYLKHKDEALTSCDYNGE